MTKDQMIAFLLDYFDKHVSYVGDVVDEHGQPISHRKILDERDFDIAAFADALLAGRRLVKEPEYGEANRPGFDMRSYEVGYMEGENSARADSALAAQQDGWQPIETAPHGEQVLLGWWYDAGMGEGGRWESEVAPASTGWRRNGVSTMSRHGYATHWRPLPAPPTT